MCTQRLVEAGSRRTVVWAATGVLVVAVLALPVTGAAGALRSVDEDPWGEVNTWLAETRAGGLDRRRQAFFPYIDEARFNVLVGGSPLIGTTGAGLRWFEDRGVDYYVASDEMFQPFLDHPEEDPGAALIYLRLLSDECPASTRRRARATASSWRRRRATRERAVAPMIPGKADAVARRIRSSSPPVSARRAGRSPRGSPARERGGGGPSVRG